MRPSLGETTSKQGAHILIIKLVALFNLAHVWKASRGEIVSHKNLCFRNDHYLGPPCSCIGEDCMS